MATLRLQILVVRPFRVVQHEAKVPILSSTLEGVGASHYTSKQPHIGNTTRVNSYNNVTEQRLFTHLEMLPG